MVKYQESSGIFLTQDVNLSHLRYFLSKEWEPDNDLKIAHFTKIPTLFDMILSFTTLC